MLGIGKGYVYWRRLCRPPFSYRQKNVSLIGGLCLPRKSVVSLTDRPDMTLGYSFAYMYGFSLGKTY